MTRKNMLEVILGARADEIANISKKDYEKLKKDSMIKVDMESVERFIEKLPLQERDRKKLIDMLYEMEFISNTEFAYTTDKYYKAGFSDAVNIIFDSLEYKK